MEGEKKIGDIFLGSLKTKRRKRGEEFMVGHLCLETICDHIPDYMVHEGSDGKHYIAVIIQRSQENGGTHSISLDSYFNSKKNNPKEN